MIMKRIYMLFLAALMVLASCADLDVMPPNLVTDENLMTNESGMKVYLARMYSRMPYEDFKYMAKWGWNQSAWLGAMGIEGTGEAVNRDDISTSFRGEETPYWGVGFTLIR